MLSRLHDARVFTSSDDVVFSASSSQAVQRNGARSQRLHASPASRCRPRDRRAVAASELLAEEEFKSDSDTSDDQDAPADDELDEEDEDEDEETKWTAGLRFPLQSPRHIAASHSYLHRDRRRDHLLQPAVASPVAGRRRRDVKKLLDGDGDDTSGREDEREVATVSKEFMRRKIQVQYHDRPMELVYLSTGEIRPRDECPPGLRLPPSTQTTDPRRLLEHALPQSAEAQEKTRHHGKKTPLDTSVASSTVPITRQEPEGYAIGRGQERPSTIQTTIDNGKTERTREWTTSTGSENARDTNKTDRRYGAKHAGRRGITKNAHEDEAPRRPPLPTRHDNNSPASSEGEERKAVRSESAWSRAATSQVDVKPTGARDLGAELKKEKKRVLETVTQLLNEQGKTRALQHEVELLQDKVTAIEMELKSSARKSASMDLHEGPLVQERDDRIKVLSDEVRAKDEMIRRLERQLEQALKDQNGRADKATTKDENKIARLRQREAACAKQLEDLMNRVTEFHSQVECWKVNSREALEGCGKRSDILELMDRLWLDFPPFISSSDTQPRNETSEGESSTIAFLTKKLRQKEEELRIAHVKYVELKELCARQCIREADLQNFINDHRLRGNLVIRKTIGKDAVTQPSVRCRDQENQQTRANSERNAGVGEALELHSDADDDESDGGKDLVVRKPKVFIDIKHSNRQNGAQQEPSPIEHVRLAPSPALAQRCHNQQQQQQQRELQSARATAGASNRSTDAPTVSSASRTLTRAREALKPASATNRTGTSQKRSAQTRTATAGRTAGIPPKAASTRASTTSRRPSNLPLTSRPWV